jgi:hypothetical protein
MIRLSSATLGILLAFSAPVAMGCTISTNSATDAGMGSASGRLEVDWSIAGSVDPSSCTTAGASYVRIDVLDSNGTKVNNGADTQTCTAFATTFATAFSAGSYTVQSTLLGSDSVTAVTTTVSAPVVIPTDGTTVRLPIDFPTTSFITPVAPTGKLEVYWSIEGSKDASYCSSHGVAYAQVEVLDSAGTKLDLGGDSQACSAFGTAFSPAIAAGTYTVHVTLVDDASTALTTSTTSTTVISDGATARVDVDFPASSFF